MKKIDPILWPTRLEAVKAALDEGGITGMTVSNMRGMGRASGLRLHPKVKLRRTVRDEAVEEIIALILAQAHTGEAGDGKIFVLPALDAGGMHIGEAGEGVL